MNKSNISLTSGELAAKTNQIKCLSLINSFKKIDLYVSSLKKERALTCVLYGEDFVQTRTFSIDAEIALTSSFSDPEARLVDFFLSGLLPSEQIELRSCFPIEDRNFKFALLLELVTYSYEKNMKLALQEIKIADLLLVEGSEPNKITFSFELDGKAVGSRFLIDIWENGQVEIHLENSSDFDIRTNFFDNLELKYSDFYPEIDFSEFCKRDSYYFQSIVRFIVLREYVNSKTYKMKAKFNPAVALDEAYLYFLENDLLENR